VNPRKVFFLMEHFIIFNYQMHFQCLARVFYVLI
jgi:hypothetical protein